LESPSHRRITFQRIPRQIPKFLRVGERAIKTAFNLLGYCRRVSKKKGFSNDPNVCQERLTFAYEGITWPQERVVLQIFSDEV